MERETTSLFIKDLQRDFLEIEFPRYQREPDIWSRDQKQRLIDSILRRFDIASVYFYRKEDGTLECIDGRQRLNAIMSFFAENPSDERDNGFPLRIENEISSGLATDFDPLNGHTYQEIERFVNDEKSRLHDLSKKAKKALLEYKVTTVYLSGTRDEEEFNLQFLRLNLGTLINAGEKLHAMVGTMRNIVFADDEIGKHPFFESVKIPTRRYAKELTAAQVLLQIFTFSELGEFTRARHFDLQRFLKQYEDIDPADPLIGKVRDTLDAINDGVENASDYLRNRAVTVSLVLLAWGRKVPNGDLQAEVFWKFAKEFAERLKSQVEKMKSFKVDPEYQHLVEFQRHLTQAAVEKPALTRRHEILNRSLDQWLQDGKLEGDREYEERIRQNPEES